MNNPMDAMLECTLLQAANKVIKRELYHPLEQFESKFAFTFATQDYGIRKRWPVQIQLTFVVGSLHIKRLKLAIR